MELLARADRLALDEVQRVPPLIVVENWFEELLRAIALGGKRR